MPIGLAALPVELAEQIFDQLNERSIYALRLVSRSLQQSTIHRFRKAFAHRTTDLSTNSLQTLLSICDHRCLGLAVQSLTIVATYYDTEFLRKVLDTKHPYNEYAFGPVMSVGDPCSEAELAETAANVDILEQRKGDQVNAARSGSDLVVLTAVLRKASNLRKVTLEAGMYRHPETRLAVSKARNLRPQVWEKATHVYLITMLAIAQSRLSIEELHVYGGRWGCSVLGYDVHASVPLLETRGIETALASLRILSMNCTTRFIDAIRPCCGRTVSMHSPSSLTESDQQFVSSAVDNEMSFGPARLLTLFPNLEELELIHYQLHCPSWCPHGGTPDYEEGYEKVFAQIAQTVQLPRLLKCKLRGQAFSEYAIVHFLKNSPLLNHLELRLVNLKGLGAWSNIFEQCKKLETLTLRQLYADQRLLYWTGKSAGDEPYDMTVDHEQLQRGIDYLISLFEADMIWVTS